MGANKSRKPQLFLYVILIIVGLIVACGSFVPNEYVKFGIVLISLCVGVLGTFSVIGQSDDAGEELEKVESDESK